MSTEGDSFFVVFGSAGDAVAWPRSAALTPSSGTPSWPPARRLDVTPWPQRENPLSTTSRPRRRDPETQFAPVIDYRHIIVEHMAYVDDLGNYSSQKFPRKPEFPR
jgi:hypothetical protein